jgi:hypothetical protein
VVVIGPERVLLLGCGLTAVLVAATVRRRAACRAGGGIRHEQPDPRILYVLAGAGLGLLLVELAQSLAGMWPATRVLANGAKNVCGPGKVSLLCLAGSIFGAAGGALGGSALSNPYGSPYSDPFHDPFAGTDRPWGPVDAPPGYVPPQRDPDAHRDPDFRAAQDKYLDQLRQQNPPAPPPPPKSWYEQTRDTFIKAILTGGGKSAR